MEAMSAVSKETPPMTPNLKDALDEWRSARQDIFANTTTISSENATRWKRLSDAEDALMKAALATLPPDPTTSKKEVVENERREAIARAICKAKGVNPDCLHQNYDDEPIDHTDARGRTYHYGWRNQLHLADAAILASGLVQDEAVWRTMESAPRDGTTILVVGHPSQIKGVKIGAGIFTAYWDDIDSSFCLSGATWQGPFIDPTHWQPLPAPPIRSARNGCAS